VIGDAHQDEPIGIGPEGGEARPGDPTQFAIEGVLLDPNERTALGRPQSQAEPEAAGGGRVLHPGRRIGFMQGGAPESAAQWLVEARHPRRNQIARRRACRRIESGKHGPERRQGIVRLLHVCSCFVL